MTEQAIADRVRGLLATLPAGVLLVGAAKMRTPDEARAAIEAGLVAIGHNYIQQAEAMRAALREWESQSPQAPRWHFIGHLQTNKAKKAAALFDVIETIDSLRIARALDRHCADLEKIMPILIEINSGEESNKTGVPPEKAEDLVREIAALRNVRIQGLMTMGPRFGDPEDARPYFRLSKELFDRLSSANLQNVGMRFLSMGMSNTYRVAVEEGANVVRIGTKLFGMRDEGCDMKDSKNSSRMANSS